MNHPTSREAPQAAVPHIGFGHVWHTRLRPRRHRFIVPTFFLMLPMRTLRERPEAAGVLALNRAGALSFHDRDHGIGPQEGGALAWLEALLQAEGINDAQGEVWLQCYPRVLGYSFKPVSFWYCHRKDGSLRAIVAEVNNTFGERHAYLLDHPRYGQTLQACKRFHVSPFCVVEGAYHFEFRRVGAEGLDAARVRIDYHDAQGPLLLTGMAGRLEPLTAASRRRALWRYPLLTLGVMTRILWHAFLLYLKRVPFHSKPRAPAQPVSRSSATDS
ncbi:DUF1365 domain-containing protein [Bordetella avium]|uniref:DUF1365 domain-containing protein n=1 Tax=Bordetella avium (strain 197N) TaxID=360910 RepID=Q2KZJ7_BORA1|nr:DUF1365 domain-containing protein [Bordetella avium]AZY52751.1 DUF1365 domain-containing protein [Bordetella avium]RIQ19088.1 DUF1365 domain-containing protein [Bordetella avium]RIQ31998.1 DUF1365 domain-containing protein [Bordetella avium]RIQ52655.1 DUF1365 domain-containing protein [Bordetella avium]RIQ56796.1 DUF1365 domain-containing protein [Bordetella avium]